MAGVSDGVEVAGDVAPDHDAGLDLSIKIQDVIECLPKDTRDAYGKSMSMQGDDEKNLAKIMAEVKELWPRVSLNLK